LFIFKGQSAHYISQWNNGWLAGQHDSAYQWKHEQRGDVSGDSVEFKDPEKNTGYKTNRSCKLCFF